MCYKSFEEKYGYKKVGLRYIARKFGICCYCLHEYIKNFKLKYFQCIEDVIGKYEFSEGKYKNITETECMVCIIHLPKYIPDKSVYIKESKDDINDYKSSKYKRF